MFRKPFVLLIAAVLTISGLVPTVRAAEEPLVLHDEIGIAHHAMHYYLKDGTPARTEWISRGTGSYTDYVYAANILIEESEYEDNKLYSRILYDRYGTEIQETRYDESGKVTYRSMGEPTYDEFGRLTNWCSQELDDPYRATHSIRYEYYGEPTVFLGNYEQDGNRDNGPEPIEWLVLGAEGKNLLLVSKYGLDSRSYHSAGKSVKWETSEMRTWLNKDFYNTAFSGSPASYQFYYQSMFKLYETPKSNISDKVFLLSEDEVEKYLPKGEDRLCEPTPYAIQQNAYVKNSSGTGWWLLRTLGKTNREVVNINTDGSINSDGAGVAVKRGLIRPAMWVNKTIFSDSELTPSRKHENITMFNPETEKNEYLSSKLYTYDDWGHLICEQDYLTGEMTTWKYDDHGNLSHWIYLTSGNTYTAETTYTNRYSDDGLLLEQEAYTVTTENYNDNPEIKTDRKRETYVYDKAGNHTFTLGTYDDGTSYTKTYDTQGHLLTVAHDGVVDERYTYVPLSQALAK